MPAVRAWSSHAALPPAGRARAAAVGLLRATSLPFLVAATSIGVQLETGRPAVAAALVAAGLVSVLLFPAVAVGCCAVPRVARGTDPVGT